MLLYCYRYFILVQLECHDQDLICVSTVQYWHLLWTRCIVPAVLVVTTVCCAASVVGFGEL